MPVLYDAGGAQVIKITIDVDSALRAVDITMSAVAPVVGVAVAEAVRNVVAPYPSATRKQQPFKSDKSRRFFFAALRSGQITVPYQRTGVTGRSWMIEPTGDGAVLSNNAPSAQYVHAAATQAAYHRGNWTTDVEGAEQAEQSGVAQKAAEAALDDVIKKAGGS